MHDGIQLSGRGIYRALGLDCAYKSHMGQRTDSGLVLIHYCAWRLVIHHGLDARVFFVVGILENPLDLGILSHERGQNRRAGTGGCWKR